MIVDDAHALVAVVSAEFNRSGRPEIPLYLDARIPSTLHLRLIAALYKPTQGRLSRKLQVSIDEAQQSGLLTAIANPRRAALTVLDDRLVAGAIGPISTEPGVSVAFAALIAHAHMAGQPILVDPANEGRWQDAARARHIEVVVRPA